MTQSNINSNDGRTAKARKSKHRLVMVLALVALWGFLYLCSEFDDLKQGYLDGRDGKAYNYTH